MDHANCDVYKQFSLTMSSKSSIKYASVDVHQSKNVESKKVPRKIGDAKVLGKGNRRSHSLDRIADDTSGDSREERRNRRQFIQLVSNLH